MGDLMTLGFCYMNPVPDFRKPVLILNGQQDYFYCGGNCLAENKDLTAETLSFFYPNADSAKSEAVTLPNTGHNLHMHYSRHDVHEETLKFISDAGIKP
jgi:pimeloyl-ACP methyl ester carboxylesterase